MAGWKHQPCIFAAICSLTAIAMPATAGAVSVSSHVPAFGDAQASTPATLKPAAQPDAQLHIASSHQTAELGVVNGTSVNSSVSYNLSGAKSGLPAMCYGQLCNASACYPSATVSVKKHVNYANVTALLEFSRRHIVSLCNAAVNSSCEIAANGAGKLQNITQLSDTMVAINIQMTAEGKLHLWWKPTDCSGQVMKIHLSTVTYDITPPTLAVIADIGKYTTTLANTSSQTNTTSASTAQLQRNRRQLQYFTLQAASSSSSSETHAQTDTASASTAQLQHSRRRLQYFTLQATSPSSSSDLMYGTNVVFNFSEPVQGFSKQYAFIKGGALSSSGLNETVSQQQYTATVVSDSTDQPLLMITGSTYQDLAGNVGVADLSTSLPVGVLSTASTNSTASSTAATLTPGTIVVIVLANIVGIFLLIWLCVLCAQARKKLKAAEEERKGAPDAIAASAAGAAATAAATTAAAKHAAVICGKAASKADLKGTMKGADLDVKPSAPTSVPLRVRFGTASPQGTVANSMFAQDDTAPRSGSASSAAGLASMRSELPLSTLGAPRVSEDDNNSQDGSGLTPLTQSDRQGSLERSDSAMLASHPSGPLIHDPSGVYAYGSGSYEGPITGLSGYAEESFNTPVTPRARSRLANASDAGQLPRATTAAGSRAWKDVDLNSDD